MGNDGETRSESDEKESWSLGDHIKGKYEFSRLSTARGKRTAKKVDNCTSKAISKAKHGGHKEKFYSKKGKDNA